MNTPILYQNIMYGLPSDFAREVFLWAVERPNEDTYCYRAESFAHEANILLKKLTPLIKDKSLMKFIFSRHANYRYGGNLIITYY